VGHTTLVFRDRDDYFNDADVLVVLHMLIAKARSQPDRAWQHPELIPSWENALDTTGPGFVDVSFNELSDAARTYVVELLRELQTDLKDKDAVPERSVGNWRVPDLILGDDYDAARVRDTLERLTRLLS